MKWVKRDYKGNTQTWYSADFVEQIRQTCYDSGLIHHKNKFEELVAVEGNPLAAKILRIIESEGN